MTHTYASVCVLGAGRTGIPVARYVHAHYPEAVVVLYAGGSSVMTPELEELEAAGIEVITGTEEVAAPSPNTSFDLCISSPGIPHTSAFATSAEAHAQELISEPEFAWRESRAQVSWLAVTGTNGKTTTTSMLTEMLKRAGRDARAVGNIGKLITAELESADEHTTFVAELSSFQLDETSTLKPRAAIVLNITPDHLEWHGSMKAYAEAKAKIFAAQTSDDLSIVSIDDAYCQGFAEELLAKEAKGEKRMCALSVETVPSACFAYAAYLQKSTLCLRVAGKEVTLCERAELLLEGLHNAQNALAAAAAAYEVGVSVEIIVEVLKSFSALEHRIEPVATVDRVRFVNDSKGTNTDATIKALGAFEPKEIIVLLGGHDKHTDLTDLVMQVQKTCKTAVCYGEAGPRIYEALVAAGVQTELTAHMREAFTAALEHAEAGNVVLLSPACSSFDEFSGMAERGRVFKELVKHYELAAHTSA